MMPQSAPTSFHEPRSPHLHIEGETCPWCEQEIPPERLEEIRGKIAAHERERMQAITAKFEQQYASDKEQVDAKAKADLELERRQSAAREAAAREEARKAAEAAAAEKLADAQAKTADAEGKLSKLSEQHEKTRKEELDSQREILEKAADDRLNAREAKFSAEKQKLNNTVDELKRKIENMTAGELGEGAEIDLFEALKKAFPDDRIDRVAKGAPGADILHVVMHNGRECGTIIFDSKNHKAFRNEHVTKLLADQLAAKAEYAILSTQAFPRGMGQLHMQDGVVLANPARVVFVVTLIRRLLLQAHTLRLSSAERESKTAALYRFITSERFTQHLSRIDARTKQLHEQLATEIKWHNNDWRKRGEAICAIEKVPAELSHEISCIIGTVADDELALEDLNDDHACHG
jgi:hypothetical protein